MGVILLIERRFEMAKRDLRCTFVFYVSLVNNLKLCVEPQESNERFVFFDMCIPQ